MELSVEGHRQTNHSTNGGVEAVAYEWVAVAVGLVALGLFVGALERKFPPLLGGIGGFVVGLGVLFPAGCVTRSDPVEETVCHSVLGVPVPEEAGMVGGLLLAVSLAMLFVWLSGRSDEE